MQNRLALGTVQFGMNYGIANKVGQIPVNECAAILAHARAAGVDTIDTAALYGSSEEVLGAIGVAGFHVVTKLPGLPVECTDVAAWAREQIGASLTRLRQAGVYALLLHRPADLLLPSGRLLFDALRDLKASGHAVKIGYSVYAPAELDALFPAFPPDIVQLPGNVLDRRFRNCGWLDRLKGAGIEVHVRSAFLQGLLLTSPSDLADRFLPWKPLLVDWHAWCEANGLAPFEACLAYLLKDNAADRIIIGVDSASQFSQILAGVKKIDSRHIEFPDRLQCRDEHLVNPANWSNG
jgi:aryl-alcohol dehydrogenase-like predicted oxidoreductase